MELLLRRRSIRRFLDREVPLEVLIKIVNVARHAPSGKNRQPWEFIIITDEDILKRLGNARRPSSEPLLNAKAAIAIVTDPNTPTHIEDGACVAIYVWLAAVSMGLGAVWINPGGVKEMYEILGLPEGRHLHSIIAIGWPAEKPKPKRLKRLSELVHINTYGNKLKEEVSL